MAGVCAQHPEAVAVFVCDGCQKNLCGECVDMGHALIFCKLCGERALPLSGAAPIGSKEVRRKAALAGPYSLGEAFLYPFRGLGKYLFLAALLCKGGIEFLLRFGGGCYRYVIAVAFWSLLIGLQFKIARSTARGENELPDWPEYFSWGERIYDILIYLVLMLWQFGPAALYAVAFRTALLTPTPNLFFWLGFAILAWLGVGLGAIGLGAAGKFMPEAALRIDRHARAFAACRGDALPIANVLFGLGVGIWVIRLGLTSVPFAGAALAGILGAYWLFVSAHLAGLIFRRNEDTVADIYGD